MNATRRQKRKNEAAVDDTFTTQQENGQISRGAYEASSSTPKLMFGVSSRSIDEEKTQGKWWPLVLDLKQASAYTGLSYWYLRDCISTGLLPRFKQPDPFHRSKHTTRILITRTALDHFVEKHQTKERETS